MLIIAKEISTLKNESRIARQVDSLLTSGLFKQVAIAGRLLPGQSKVEVVSPCTKFYRLPMLRGSTYPSLEPIRTWFAGSRLVKLAEQLKAVVIQSNDLITLRLCARVKSKLNIPFVYAPHELETEQNGLAGEQKQKDKIWERKTIHSADAIVVVCDSIADWYEQEYGVTRPIVVRNIPELGNAFKNGRNQQLFRNRFPIQKDHLIFLYQGGLFSGRRIEQFIRVFSKTSLDRHIVFMGYGAMESTVRKAVDNHPNIHFMPAVPPEDLLQYTASADVGLVGMENVCLSYFYSLPNKIFEFISAGIPFLFPGYPEMIKLAKESNCGWVVGETDDEWLEAINNLNLTQVQTGSLAALRAADSLSWRSESHKFVSLYAGLLPKTLK